MNEFSHQNAGITKFLRSEISFYGTVVVAVFAVAAMYFGLSGRMDLFSQKFEFALGNYNDINAKVNGHDLRITAIEKDFALLKATIPNTCTNIAKN